MKYVFELKNYLIPSNISYLTNRNLLYRFFHKFSFAARSFLLLNRCHLNVFLLAFFIVSEFLNSQVHENRKKNKVKYMQLNGVVYKSPLKIKSKYT